MADMMKEKVVVMTDAGENIGRAMKAGVCGLDRSQVVFGWVPV